MNEVAAAKSKIGGGDQKEKAAVWAPDDSATTCPVCSVQKFTLLNRKHHCRFCGTVVCGGCSKNRAQWGDKDNQRICDNCVKERKAA
jgi:hypothetical protein